MLVRFLKNYRELFFYCIAAILIGILIGAIDAIFGEVLLKITEFRDLNTFKLVPFLPLAGIMIMLLYRKFSKESLKGMTLVFQAGLGNSNYIPKMLVPLVILCTWITHLFGGSAGREGVAVQLGATVAHTIGKWFKFPNNSRALLVIGMAAGFSGLFQTPLAATFFAMEVLVSGVLMYEVLLPTLIASYAASMTSHLLGLEKFSIDISNALNFTPEVIVKVIALGIIFGIVGGLFAYALSYCKQKLASVIENPIKRIFLSGILLSILLLVLHSGRYCGLGTNLIATDFNGGQVYPYDWLLKIVLTILTLSAGFQGGEVTPLFSIGASLGLVLGNVLGLPPMLMAALGYAAVFGSATNTLIAPIFIGIEIFGPQNALYFAIVCAIAYTFNGNKTIYTAQKKFPYFSNLT